MRLRACLSLVLVLALGVVASGCFFFGPRGGPTPKEEVPTADGGDGGQGIVDDKSSIVPDKGSAAVATEWKALPQLPGDTWQTRDRGIGSPALCRISEDALSLWCFARFAGAWVELWRVPEDKGQSIVDFDASASSQRLALLVKDTAGTLTILASEALFLQFQAQRTFPKSDGQPTLRNVVFLGEELLVYGEGAMLSERSSFLEPLPGADTMPGLGKMSFLAAGYLLAVDQAQGVVVQNAPDALTSWSPVQLPEEGTQARALSIATEQSALAMVYNDGSVYWRCNESEGLRLMRFEEKVAGVFWFRSTYGLHLAVRTARRIDLVTTTVKAPLSLPQAGARILDAGALNVDRMLIQTDAGYLEGVVKPHLTSLTCKQ